MTDQPAIMPTALKDEAAEHLIEAYDLSEEPEHEAEPMGQMTDETLRRAYQRTDDEPGHPASDALLAENRAQAPGLATTEPYTPAAVAAMPLDPEPVAALDEDALALSMDAASDDDRPFLLAEMARRGLEV